MSDEKFDDFLNEATHGVAGEWFTVRGKRLTVDELYALNDLLTAFFADKRSD